MMYETRGRRSLFPIPLPNSYPLTPLPFLLLLTVFALYAPALRVALLHDDAANIFWLQPQRWSDLLFFDAAAGGASARPLSNALWMLTRDLFGWFSPPILHAWNLWLHVLNTALVYALAKEAERGEGRGKKEERGERKEEREKNVTRRGKPPLFSHFSFLFPLPSPLSPLFPILAAAFFAFFPFHYQPVIWAGSIYHPVMLACGLTALIASLRRRWFIAALGAIGALFAHEGGFVFALILGGVHTALAVQRRRRPAIPALLIGALGIAYPLLFRFVLGAVRFTGDAPNAFRIEDLWPNTLYFLQGLVPFVSARLRPIIGLTPQWPAWILGSVLISVPIGLGLAARARRLPLALGALAAWVVLVAPAIIGLDRQYVVNGPRLHYSASVAVAIFWSTAALGMRGERLERGEERGVNRGREKTPSLSPLPSSLFPLSSPLSPLPASLPSLAFFLFLAAGCFDSAVFAHVALREATSVSRTMFTVDHSLHDLPTNARVLYINAPWYSSRTSPHFLVGSEGMPIYQHDGTFPSTWIGAQSNTLRDTTFVRHDISLTHGKFWSYGSPGAVVDDAALATQMLAADEIWRWDYDGRGVRVRRVARITRNMPAPTAFAARLAEPDSAPGDVAIVRAEAQRRNGYVLLTIEWHITTPPTEPTGVKIHGFAADGAQIFNADAQPFMGLVPITALAPGTRLLETREIPLDHTKPAPHHIELGLYRSTDFAAFGDGVMVDVSD